MLFIRTRFGTTEHYSGLTLDRPYPTLALMDSKPKTSAEYDKFRSAMKRLVGVPLSEVKALEKKKKRRPRRPSASRAANAKS